MRRERKSWIGFVAVLLVCGCSSKPVELPDKPTDGPTQPPVSSKVTKSDSK